MLVLSDVEAFYGASQALFGVGFTVRAGEAVALVGRNGMGKTTTVRAIMGLNPPRRGEIVFAGRPIAGLPPHAIARAGIGLVPEGRQIFPNLSVRENLIATAADRGFLAEPWTLARVFALFPRLGERREAAGAHLSGGEQQMLAIGRALMTNPRLVILDEATEGLAPLVRREIWACLQRIKAAGQALLVVDKPVAALLDLADRLVVLEKGRVVWTGTPAGFTADDVRQRYLGV